MSEGRNPAGHIAPSAAAGGPSQLPDPGIARPAPRRLPVWRLVVASLVVSLAWGAPATAQRDQPVYPVYDGFLVTDDGTYVIAFAYFSHNHGPVTVPVGADNTFGPEPADRRQPTTFQPGHHRFQCVMVMDPGFDGGLGWTLAYGGATTSTSEDMLQYNWELEDRTARLALRDVDVTTAPRGVCLNRSPIVRLLGLRNGPDGEPPEVSATTGRDLKLFGSASDEGLPREGRLTTRWRALSGPGPVTFSAPAEPRTLARFDRPGTYELELTASDSLLQSSTRLVVHVDGEAVD